MYDVTFTTTQATMTGDSVDAATGIAIGMAVLFFVFIIMAGAYVFTAIFTGMIFKKAGVPAWKAWVPFYNIWKFFEIGGQAGALSLFMYVPFLNIVGMVFMAISAYNIGLKLGKDGIYVLLWLFISPVWLILLGIEKSPWNEGVGAPSKAFETAAMYAHYGQQVEQPQQ